MPSASRPLRIVMAISQYAPTVGGAERQAQAVSEELVRRGHEVTVLTRSLPGAEPEETIGGVRVLRRLKATALGPLWGLTYMWTANRELRRLERWADLIHCHEVYFHTAIAARRRKRGGPPVVCKAVLAGDDGDLARMKRRRGGALWMKWIGALDRAIAICGPIEHEFRAAGFAPERIVRIPNFVDTVRFPACDETMAGHEWLFAGRLHPSKGADILLRGLYESAKRGGEEKVAFAGQGPQRAELESLAKSLGISRRVRFLGMVEDPAALYANAKGLILPSLAEGLSNTLLEALASQKPVLATDVGGTREVLEGGIPLEAGALHGGFSWAQNGILIRPGDPAALASALDSARRLPERLAERARNGAEWIRAHYSKDATLDLLEALYQDLAR